MIALTFVPTKSIREQQEIFMAGIIDEDKYFLPAGEIYRPLPDNWPWTQVEERLTLAQVSADTAQKTADENKVKLESVKKTANAGFEKAKVTETNLSLVKITAEEGKKTAEGAKTTADQNKTDIQSLTERVTTLEG